MPVVGARVPLALEQRVQQHCHGLGKTPSEWIRELLERELSGKTPSPALGDAVQGLAALVGHNTQLLGTVLAVSVGVYKALVQMEVLSHPERAKQIEDIHRQFAATMEGIPAQEQVAVETGLRISDLASEIARIRNEKQILEEVYDG